MGSRERSFRMKVDEKGMKTTAEELQHGQIVLITARWALVLAGLVLLMWRPPDVRGFSIGILVLLTLAVINFFLHVQILRNRPIARDLVYGMSIADLAVISVISDIRGGFDAHTFAFYYPAILVYSLVFPGHLTVLLTGGVMALYAVICVSTPDFDLFSELDQQVLVARLLMIVAVAYLAYRYRLVEKRRLEELHAAGP